MKRMLFNATQAEELRVAIVDGQKLIDLDIESAAKEQRKSNIYKAVITRIEPSLEAAFVDYGAERHGFLPFKEVARAYFQPNLEPGRAKIQDALKVGQELIVQVEKDERGNKGAALTTFISLAGRYLVLMPNNPRGGGVSRRIEGEDRQELREVMDQLEVPNGMSLIARTAGIGRSAEELQWDLNYLLQLWGAIEGAAQGQTGAFLIYQESSLVIRAIRDYFHSEIGEILIDTDDIYEQAQQFMAHVMPGNVNRVKRYHDDVPLFSRFQIEHQIESAYSRQVNLPSGGAIVIDHTEALVSVDVNSGRATKGSDIEETAFRTNCEAADEIARQLRLRDLGGLIVIDFIDMESSKNQREVENRLRDALHHDRARVQTGKISRFGLLELSRQRLRPALAETSYITCPRCTGTGHIRSTESAALHILRILEEEAMKENTGALHCQVPVDVGTFLLNEKRVDIARIEARHRVNLVIVPNRHLETPAHEIIRLRHDQLNAEGLVLASYQMAEKPLEETYQPPSAQNEAKPAKAEAAVKGITPDQPAPVVEPRPAREGRDSRKAAPATTGASTGFFGKIIAFFSGGEKVAEPVVEEKPARNERNGRNNRNGRGEGGERNRNRRDGRGEGRNNREGRGEREERPAREGGDRKEREPREAREPRQPRQPREDQASPNQQAVAQSNGAPAAEGGNREPRERRPRGERGDRPPRQESQRLEAAAAPVAENGAPAPAEGEGQGERRRGRRGGRGRGERRPENGNNAADQQVQADSLEATPPTQENAQGSLALHAPVEQPIATVDAPAVTGEALPVTAAVEAQIEAPIAPVTEPVAPAVQVTAAPETAEAPAISTAAEPVPVVESAPVTPTAPAPAPVIETAIEPVAAPAVVAAVPVPVAKPEELAADLEKAGLLLVETVADKVKPVAEIIIPQQPLGRKPKAPVVIPEEPLQLVETRRDA